MKKDEKGFSIQDLVPPEDVASGQHQPSGENLWAVPSFADDDIEDDEDIKKEALGLTSVPQSLYGGEVLTLPGSPQPPGLSREMGDDEETDLFGAESDIVDAPPEHYKEQRYPSDSKKDMPAESFFDFLFTNNKLESENSSIKDNNMKKALFDLAINLKKIGEKEAAKIISKAQVTDMDLEYRDQARTEYKDKYKSYFGQSRVPSEEVNRLTEVVKNDFYNKFIKRLKYIDRKNSARTDEIEQLFSDIIMDLTSDTPQNANIEQYSRALLEAATRFLHKINKNNREVWKNRYQNETLYNVYTNHIEKMKDLKRSLISLSAPSQAPADQKDTGSYESERQPTSSYATGWESYISKTPDGEKVRDAWIQWSSGVEGYTPDFSSWVSWYNQKVKELGRHLSVNEVVNSLSDSPSQMVAKPEEEGTAVPESPQGEQQGRQEGMEERDIAVEDSDSVRRNIEQIIADVFSGKYRLRGPFTQATAKRRIRRLGGVEGAAEAVIAEAGGLDNLMGYSRERRTNERGNLVLSQLESAVIRLLKDARKTQRRSERVRASEERIELLYKIG